MRASAFMGNHVGVWVGGNSNVIITESRLANNRDFGVQNYSAPKLVERATTGGAMPRVPSTHLESQRSGQRSQQWGLVHPLVRAAQREPGAAGDFPDSRPAERHARRHPRISDRILHLLCHRRGHADLQHPQRQQLRSQPRTAANTSAAAGRSTGSWATCLPGPRAACG